LEVIIRGLEAQFEVTPNDEYYRSYLIYVYYEAFKKKLKDKEYEKANEFLEKAGRILKDHRYHFYRALLLKELGDVKNAEIELKSSLNIKEDFYLGYYELGNLLKEKAEYEDAITAFSNSIRLMPNFVLPYLKIADIYMEKGIFSSAKIFLEKILEIDENFVEALLRLGVLHNIEQKYSKAAEYFKKALNISPHRWEIRYNLAFSLSRCDKHFEAINELKKIIKSGIDEPYVYNELALLYKNVGLYEEALENIKIAIDKSETWDYLLNGAKIALLLGDYKNSLDLVIRSIEMVENKNQEILSKYWLSRIYLEFDEFANAFNTIKDLETTSLKLQALETFLEKAVRVYPNPSTLLDDFYGTFEMNLKGDNVDIISFSELIRNTITLDVETRRNIDYLLENNNIRLLSAKKGSYDIFPTLFDLMLLFGHKFAVIERNLTKIVIALHSSTESLAATRLLIRIYEYIFLGSRIEISELLDETIAELQDLNWNFALKISTISKLQEREEIQLLHELMEKDLANKDLFHFMKYLIVILMVDSELENIELIKNKKMRELLYKMKKLRKWAKEFISQ